MTSSIDITQVGAMWLLLLLVSLAVATDLAWRRVPNALIAGMLACALSAQLWLAGGSGVLSALGGLLLGGLLLLPLYALGGMGAGDVKLLAAAGAFLGPWWTLKAGIYVLVAGGVLALALATYRAATAHARPRSLTTASSAPERPIEVPYSLAIAAGVGIAVFQAALDPSASAVLGGGPVSW